MAYGVTTAAVWQTMGLTEAPVYPTDAMLLQYIADGSALYASRLEGRGVTLTSNDAEYTVAALYVKNFAADRGLAAMNHGDDTDQQIELRRINETIWNRSPADMGTSRPAAPSAGTGYSVEVSSTSPFFVSRSGKL